MYKLISAPVDEPLTTEEVKKHLRVTHNDQDNLIIRLSKAARKAVETYCRRQIMPATWELYLDDFPRNKERTIFLERSPVTSIISVKYVDTDKVEQTLDSGSYVIDYVNEPARITEVKGSSWPSVNEQTNAVIIRFTAGYNDADSVPEDIKQAILMICGHLYSNPQDVVTGTQVNKVPKASEYLLEPYRAFRF